MKKFILALSSLISLGWNVLGQENADSSNWKFGGMGSFTFSQVSLVNWAAGGESSMSGNLFVNLNSGYKKGKSTWDNNLDLGYGLVKQSDQKTRKSDDRIDFSSKYGRIATGKLYYSVLLNFKSQFAAGYLYPKDSVISNFMAPGYILLSLGMDYKPNDRFSLYFSPLTEKMTIVNDKILADSYGVEAGKTVRSELGGFLKIMYKKDIMKNVNLLTKLDLFSNYGEDPQNIDAGWEVIITMKINKYLTANFNTHLIYDDDIQIDDGEGNLAPRVQFKEVFGVGLSYKL
ncbi:MAG: DUF3078 domain-containing protein [Bacteroidales bacterium]|nr:MAG: DUF3078 domain-containing protein [Bacteroidales bacterium]